MTDGVEDGSFNQLLSYLKRTRGFDFGAYKVASLQRRIQKRLQGVNLSGYVDYIDYLEVHPEEFKLLFNTILINVTEFFRDAPAWQVVAEWVLPRLLEPKTPGDPVRVWSAGCAAGQEAYSIAMLLAEALGDSAYRQRVKIYATDVDEEALSEARQATYSEGQMQSVPEALRVKYFERANGNFAFRKDLRRAVIFGRHDLLQDAPISRVDLLICRNTLMYFNAEAQARVLSRFDFALNSTGFLFLGKAEVMLTRSAAFSPVDIKRRIFGKAARSLPRARATAMLEGDVPGATELGWETQLQPRGLPALDVELTLAPVRDPSSAELRQLRWRVHDISGRKRAQQELSQQRGMLRELSARLQSVREEERTRIAREVHDELGGALTAIKLEMYHVRHRLATADAQGAMESTNTANRMADEMMDAVRRIATELRPALLDELGLIAAVDWQLQEFQKRTGIQTQLYASGRAACPHEVATVFFRVLQELLTNIARHSQAEHVEVRLSQPPGKLMLDVRDDGRGITEVQASRPTSLGIMGMRECVQQLGGTFAIHATDDKGTTVLVAAPVERAT